MLQPKRHLEAGCGLRKALDIIHMNWLQLVLFCFLFFFLFLQSAGSCGIPSNYLFLSKNQTWITGFCKKRLFIPAQSSQLPKQYPCIEYKHQQGGSPVEISRDVKSCTKFSTSFVELGSRLCRNLHTWHF